MDTKSGMLFVVNPASANGETGNRFRELEPEIKANFGDVHVMMTERTGHAKDLVKQGLAEGATTIISVGGDGTLNESINGFLDESGRPHNEQAVLGALVMGTGGDIRRSFGWSDDFHTNLQRIKARQIRKVDVGRATTTTSDGHQQSRYFMNEASFGMSAAVAEEMNRSGKLLGGKAGYFLASAQAVFSYKPGPVDLVVDGQQKHLDKCMFATLANGQYFGGGMRVAPNAQIDDGLFDLVSLSDISFWFFLRHGSSVYSGKHIDLPQVNVSRCQKAEVTAPEEETLLIELDGERFGQLPASFEILPRVLPLIA